MKDIGEAKKILNMKIEMKRAKGIVYLSHIQYLQKVMSKFGTDNYTVSSTFQVEFSVLSAY